MSDGARRVRRARAKAAGAGRSVGTPSDEAADGAGRMRHLDILIVDDDRALAGDLAAGLARAGHTASIAYDLADARRRCEGHAYSIVILDRLLPGADGLEFIPWLHEHGEGTSVLVLSALDELEAKVHGLDAGADDYLGKPYALEELLARISALARRRTVAPVVLRAGPLSLDRLARQVTANGKAVRLNQREFSLLEYLMLHANETVTRAMLVRDVWGYDLEPSTNVVDVHVSRLRAKLEGHGCAGLLVTEHGIGYRMRDSVA